MARSRSAVRSPTPILESFLKHTRSDRDLADNSLLSYRRDLESLETFLIRRAKSLVDFSANDVKEYLEEESREGRSKRTLTRRFAAARLFLKFLRRTGHRTGMILRQIDRPPADSSLPKVMSHEQVNRLLHAPDPASRYFARDSAILQLLYRGASASEICAVRTGDFNLAECYVRVGSDRIIPLGQETSIAFDRYLRECRPKLERTSSDILFLSRTGRRLDRVGLWMLVTRCGAQIGLGDIVSPRVIRQSFATHRLQAGADVREVQLLLGHDNIESTRVYTRTSSLGVGLP
jgi:integrase/recombinase XerD